MRGGSKIIRAKRGPAAGKYNYFLDLFFVSFLLHQGKRNEKFISSAYY
jgi:hypothetical protein